MAKRKSKSEHPSQRFAAPSSIQAGTPLKELMDDKLVQLIGESLTAVDAEFNTKEFKKEATNELAELTLTQRAAAIAEAMARQLPVGFKSAVSTLIESLGPELEQTEGNGLAPFFYLPHSHFIAHFGVTDFEAGMQANYELTKRFTAEFSVRPFLVKYQQKSLRLLKKWTRDTNPHVRRLVSEGTRPRLPWAMRLRKFQEDPALASPLLEALKDDESLYVRRSVANHLGDIAKDAPDFVFQLCERWLDEIESPDRPDEKAKARRWMIRHAVRHPAKHGVDRAVELRQRAK